jgi:hypothetical protein
MRRQKFEPKKRSRSPFEFTSSTFQPQPTLSVYGVFCSWFHIHL